MVFECNVYSIQQKRHERNVEKEEKKEKERERKSGPDERGVSTGNELDLAKFDMNLYILCVVKWYFELK